MLQDRRGQAVAAEEGPDLGRLAHERVGHRRVMDQPDPERAEGDLVQAVGEPVDLRGRFRVDRAQGRLAEVGQP